MSSYSTALKPHPRTLNHPVPRMHQTSEPLADRHTSTHKLKKVVSPEIDIRYDCRRHPCHRKQNLTRTRAELVNASSVDCNSPSSEPQDTLEVIRRPTHPQCRSKTNNLSKLLAKTGLLALGIGISSHRYVFTQIFDQTDSRRSQSYVPFLLITTSWWFIHVSHDITQVQMSPDEHYYRNPEWVCTARDRKGYALIIGRRTCPIWEMNQLSPV